MSSTTAIPNRPLLAVFPRLYLESLCKAGGMSMAQWVDEASALDVPGLEWSPGFQEMGDKENWVAIRERVEDYDMRIPLLRCSPDFTHPDPDHRASQVRQLREGIRMIARLGGQYCRVLSGQNRARLAREEGIAYAVECIQACLPCAAEHGVTLVFENHYRDEFWRSPDFALTGDIFCAIADRIDHPHFGIGYDPSPSRLAGEDPLVLLKRVARRVVTLRASDCRLLEDSSPKAGREETGAAGNGGRLLYGEIGKGLNDYHAIFTELKAAGFGGGARAHWISVEDGADGMKPLVRSIEFLKARIEESWPME